MKSPGLLGGAAAAGVLLAASPPPARALAVLCSPSVAAQPVEPLVAAVALLAWALACWLLLVALLTGGSRLPGLLGSACAHVLRRSAPAAVRRAVAVALGVGVALGSTGGSAAAANPAPSVAAAAAPQPSALALGGPVRDLAPRADRVQDPAPDLDWPATSPSARHARPPAGRVVVHAGDTLWDITEEHLPGASEAQVAAAWPAWWAANRDVIGPDPDLLHPGQQLQPPAGSAPRS